MGYRIEEVGFQKIFSEDCRRLKNKKTDKGNSMSALYY
jgi:hypothetical protein